MILLRLAALLALLLASLPWPLPAAAQALRAGWYAGEPQQFVQSRGGREVLTGLDIEMVRAIAARAGHEVSFEAMEYPALMAAVGAGTRDLATGIPQTPERLAQGRFSAAYRHDMDILVVRRGEAGRMPAPDADGLVEALRRDPGFRLGVRAGFSYIAPALDAFIADPANAARVRAAGGDAENLQRLLHGEIDGFLAERLSVALLVSARGARHAVEEAALRLPVPLHLMFSRGVPEATVAQFDRAIAALRAEGAFDRIAARFRFPVLLQLTLGSDWFFVLEVIGTVCAALAGYLAARQDRFSLLGGLVLAALTALAGGVMRDLIVGRHPIGIMTSPVYLLLVLGTVAASYAIGHAWQAMRGRVLFAFTLALGIVWVRRRRLDATLFEVADAIALCAFAVVGVAVAVGMGADPLWLWGPILGTLTGAGGGILRDVVRGGGGPANLRTGFYAEVGLAWSLAFSLYLVWRSGDIEQGEMVAAVAVTVLGGVLTRLGVVALGLKPPRLP